VDLEFDWWTNEAAGEIYQQALAELSLSVAILRVNTNVILPLRPRIPDNIEKVLELLRKAEGLDQQYREWFQSLPTFWGVQKVKWIDHQVKDLTRSTVYPGRVDWYRDLLIAYSYNVARSSQIYIWTTILRCVACLS
jgi:hypothetical protein